MAISLEVRKFINSEYVGRYAEIELPVFAEPQPSGKKAPKKTGSRRDRGGEDQDRASEDLREESEVQFERVRIHYMDEGAGEPLLLIHGPGQSLYTWRMVFSRLSLSYRVIAMDLPGHGYSSRPENFSYTVEEQAGAIALFMDAIKVQSAHIMAFSMGTAYALRLALDSPERIGKMVLLAPGGISPDMPLPIKLLDSGLFGGAASMLYGVRTVEKLLSECFFDLTVTMGPEVAGEYYKTISDTASRRALRRSFHNFDESGVIKSLRTLSVPVLIIQGTEDKWRSAEQMELFHAAIAYSGCAAVRNAGHLIHEEKYDKVISAVLEYIPTEIIDI